MFFFQIHSLSNRNLAQSQVPRDQELLFDADAEFNDSVWMVTTKIHFKRLNVSTQLWIFHIYPVSCHT